MVGISKHCHGPPVQAARPDRKPKFSFIHVADLKAMQHRRSYELRLLTCVVETSLGTKPIEDPLADLQISGTKARIAERIQHRAPPSTHVQERFLRTDLEIASGESQ
ncbi:hypothetical protein [Mesorhizobium sp. M0488]|uniref:hypothetical protein n=1 Tax=unclassified Mesorhizobium TaxID=325217 RepID=UPI00333C78F1